MTLLEQALSATEVEIETALSPPVRVNVGGQLQGDGGPGLITRLLRPRVVLRSGQSVLFKVEPAGAPDPVIRAIVGAFLVLLVGAFVLRLTRR